MLASEKHSSLLQLLSINDNKKVFLRLSLVGAFIFARLSIIFVDLNDRQVFFIDTEGLGPML